jgi:hypothetical protein
MEDEPQSLPSTLSEAKWKGRKEAQRTQRFYGLSRVTHYVSSGFAGKAEIGPKLVEKYSEI